MDEKKFMKEEPRLSVGEVGVVGSDILWATLLASATDDAPCDMVGFT